PPTPTLLSYTTLFRSHLARQLANVLSADPSEGFESTIQTTSNQFPGRIAVLSGPEALAAAQSLSPCLGTGYWSSESCSKSPRMRSEDHTSELQSRFDL